MKHRAAWAAEAAQQLNTSLFSIDAGAQGVKAARDTGVGIDTDGGGSASIAAFQMRKAQEAAQAQLRICKASSFASSSFALIIHSLPPNRIVYQSVVNGSRMAMCGDENHIMVFSEKSGTIEILGLPDCCQIPPVGVH